MYDGLRSTTTYVRLMPERTYDDVRTYDDDDRRITYARGTYDVGTNVRRRTYDRTTYDMPRTHDKVPLRRRTMYERTTYEVTSYVITSYIRTIYVRT